MIGTGNSGSAKVGNGCAAFCGHDDDDDGIGGTTESPVPRFFDDKLSPNVTKGSALTDDVDGVSMAMDVCPIVPIVAVAMDTVINHRRRVASRISLVLRDTPSSN